MPCADFSALIMTWPRCSTGFRAEPLWCRQGHRRPGRGGAPLDVASLFGYVRETNYGKWFEVRTEATGQSRLYALACRRIPTTPTGPGADHADPVLPGKLADGGDSIVVDGFACARRLHDENPEDFELLSYTAPPS